MPNKWNFSFDYFYAAIVVLGFYVPGMNLTFFFCVIYLVNFLSLICTFPNRFSWHYHMQVVLICIHICLGRGRKPFRNRKKSKMVF
ncbi:hypothetical protein WN944_021511 [Citrus x changshan-huyou]|uniref:Uncharacterized protein n=1 Tax=Citrus x changshan-huyou TaxID=2935761 RepID=A0AAP0N1X8_9ROSI